MGFLGRDLNFQRKRSLFVDCPYEFRVILVLLFPQSNHEFSIYRHEITSVCALYGQIFCVPGKIYVMNVTQSHNHFHIK